MMKKEYAILSGVVVLLVSIILFLYFQDTEEEAIVDLFHSEFQQVSIEDKVVSSQEAFIMVDIKGAIVQPGVYELKQGDRVYHAIDLAGGFLIEADEKQLNLAQLLQDEMVIYVPVQGEEVQSYQGLNGGSTQDGKVAINRVEAQELQQLPGIGPSKAAAIINYREEHGRFNNINDLLNVSGIGPKSIESLEEYLSFN